MSIDCGVCIYGFDENQPEAFYSTHRKARKAHVCLECCRIIPVGTVYEYSSGIWDGEPHSHKTCLACVEIREAFSCEGTWTYSCLWDDLEASFPHLTTGCFEKLESVEAKSLLRDRWMKWKGLTP